MKKAVSPILGHTAQDNKKYKTSFYNLDAVISVGYRINSKKAAQLRVWATQILKDHLTKGFTINEQRLNEQQDKLTELYETISFIEQSINTVPLLPLPC